MPGTPSTGLTGTPAATTFLGPISGGGSANGSAFQSAFVISFDQPITQCGLTAGPKGVLYLTAWDAAGRLLGHVIWRGNANSDGTLAGRRAGFVGIDTLSVAIGTISHGKGNVYELGRPRSVTTGCGGGPAANVPNNGQLLGLRDVARHLPRLGDIYRLFLGLGTVHF